MRPKAQQHPGLDRLGLFAIGCHFIWSDVQDLGDTLYGAIKIIAASLQIKILLA
jgi:hypothetical protein